MTIRTAFMKKFIFTFLSVTVLSAASFAQKAVGQNIQVQSPEMKHSPAQDSVLSRPLEYPLSIIDVPFIPDKAEILSINNSLIYVNKQDQVFDSIAATGGKNAKWTMHTRLGRTLKNHWDEGDTKNDKGEYTAKWKVRSKPWTHLVLQEQSKLGRVDFEAFRKSVADWVKYIRENCPNRNVIIILALNWAYNDDFALYSANNELLYRNYLAVAQENGILLCPVGLGNQAVFESEGAKGANLLHNDECHPSHKATYMAACMEYSVIFKENPENIRYVPEKLSDEAGRDVRGYVKKVLDKFTLNPEIQLSSLQQEQQGWSFAVKAGINISTLRGNLDPKSKIGPSAGVYAQYRFPGKMALEMGVAYSMMGGKFDTTTGDPQEPYTRMSVHLQYIDIPVHLKYYPYEGLNFHIGPRIGFLVDSKAKAAGMQWNADDALHTVDLGLDFGAGYELKCGFLVYAQYSVGLTDIMKQSGVKSHNDGFNIGVGWRF